MLDAHAQPLQRRQRERRRLAGAGLGAAHQVVPGEDRADGLLLDGRGRLVALGANGAEQRIGEAQIFKRSFRTQRTLSFIAKRICRCLQAQRTPSGKQIALAKTCVRLDRRTFDGNHQEQENQSRS